MNHNNRVKALVDHHMSKMREPIGNQEVLDEAGSIANHIAIFFLGHNTWLLWRAIRALFDKAHKKCGTFDISNERDLCIQKAKLKDAEKKLKFIQKRKKDCKDKRDPDKCKEAGKKIIKVLKDRKKEAKQNIKDIKKKKDD